MQAEKHKKRPPKKITPTYLHNAGLYYLERFSASKRHFKTVMMRKVKRSCMHHEEQSYEECRAMVDELADKFEKLELLNDEVYARGQVTSLRRRGKSRTAILNKMRMKGIANEDTLNVLEEIDDEDTEFQAALRLARKKKIGPFFIGEEENVQKSLGVLARAGFSYDIAKKALEHKEEEF